MVIRLDEPAPPFKLDSTEGEVSLSKFQGKWILLFTYPADFTPICEADVIKFAEKKAEFDEMEVQLLTASVDTVESHVKWIETIQEKTGVRITYPFISDSKKELARNYEILHEKKGVTYRGIFVIDPEGLTRYAAVYPLEVGRSVKETLRIIKTLRKARELRGLTEIQQAEELSKYGRTDL